MQAGGRSGLTEKDSVPIKKFILKIYLDASFGFTTKTARISVILLRAFLLMNGRYLCDMVIWYFQLPVPA